MCSSLIRKLDKMKGPIPIIESLQGKRVLVTGALLARSAEFCCMEVMKRLLMLCVNYDVW